MSNIAENDNLITMVDVGKTLYEADKIKKKSLFIRTLVIGICVIIVLFSEALFVTFYTGIYIIDGSMSPTLTGAESPYKKGGDYIYINTHIKPDYGDIVVVYSPNTVNGYTDKLIKRVVAFGGDTVKIEAGVLYVKKNRAADYVRVPESYVSDENNNPNLDKNNFPEHTVEEGCMFLLGDNRNGSEDSRGKYGDVPLKNLVGVVPKWSLRTKNASTAFYTFFHFTLFGN